MRTAIVYNFLLEATLMASIAILLMIPIRRYLRKPLTSRVLTFGWALVAIRLLCPLALPNPYISEIRSPFAEDEAIRPIAGQLKVRMSDLIANAENVAMHADSPLTESLSELSESTYNGMLSIHLMQLYVLGLLAVAAWFVICNVRFRRKLKADRIEPLSGELLTQYQELCKEYSLKPLPVWFVDPLPSACLVGVFRPYIALPLTAAPQDVLLVLRHELCHAKAKDHWWGAVRLTCCALHWFNPLVWLAAHMSRTDTELACDERVSKRLNAEGRNAYAGVLVLAASKRDLPGVAVLSTGMSMTGRKLKKRVAAILANRQMHRGLALSFVLLASMALVAAFATAEYDPPIPSYESSVFSYVTPAPVESPSGNAEQTTGTPLTAEAMDQWIAYAKQFWQTPCLNAGDVETLTWSVNKVHDASYTDVDHIEVAGSMPDGALMLVTAFLENGQVVYLSNLREMDTQYIVTERPQYEGIPSRWEPIRDFGLEALETLRPGISAGWTELVDEPSEGIAEGRTRLFFGLQADHNYRYTFSVQVQPEVRLLSFTDYTYISHKDTDRLSPGNG